MLDHELAKRGQPLRALLLGVTPEIASMRWPAGTRLLAVDRSQGMIDHVWPQKPFEGAEVVRGDWTDLPLDAGSCDVIVADACFSQVGFPAGYQKLASELERVLRRGGSFSMRAFVQPDPPEPLSALFDDLNAGRIGDFHVFKWRLNMALHENVDVGVRLGDIWDTFDARIGHPRALAEQRGWPLVAVETIDAYRDSDARYTYPSLADLRRVLEPFFEEEACVYLPYELGERCPTLRFRVRETVAA
jgi:SAM-dependent methyltransferase